MDQCKKHKKSEQLPIRSTQEVILNVTHKTEYTQLMKGGI